MSGTGKISLSVAVLGFNRHMAARGLSHNTIRNYNGTLGRLAKFVGDDTDLASITTDDLEDFLGRYRDRPTRPAGVADRGQVTLSAKSRENMRVCLSAFWTWATEKGHAPSHLVRGHIKPIQYNKPPIKPFSTEDIHAILAACKYTAPTETPLGRQVKRARTTARRDKALVLFLYDTGCRISEALGLTLDRLDLAANEASVHGKGDKWRTVPFDDSTSEALFDYLARRGVLGRKGKAQAGPDRLPVFATRKGHFMGRSGTLSLIYRLGDRAGVADCHPHRFRHTFAIEALRNGMDVFSLQSIMGHTDLKTTRKYVALANVDIKAAHRRSSPVAALGRLKR